MEFQGRRRRIINTQNATGQGMTGNVIDPGWRSSNRPLKLQPPHGNSCLYRLKGAAEGLSRANTAHKEFTARKGFAGVAALHWCNRRKNLTTCLTTCALPCILSDSNSLYFFWIFRFLLRFWSTKINNQPTMFRKGCGATLSTIHSQTPFPPVCVLRI